MVKFDFVSCDGMPYLAATWSRYEFDAKIIYPFSYGDKRTEIQKEIECRIGLQERLPVINIGEMQLYMRTGNIIDSLSVYLGRVKKEVFKYEGIFEPGPLVSLVMQNIDIQQDDITFDEHISIKIDREQQVICISFEDGKDIYQTFSLADDLIARVDKDGNLVDMIFRNVRWIDIETEPSPSQQNKVKVHSLFLTLAKFVRNLF